MSIRNAGGLPPTPSDVPEVAPSPAQGVPGAARAFDLAPPFAAAPEFAEIRAADADPQSVTRLRGFLAALGDKLTGLARAAAKDAAAHPARGPDGIPRRVPAEQLAALIHEYGTPAEARRWNAGDPKTPVKS